MRRTGASRWDISRALAGISIRTGLANPLRPHSPVTRPILRSTVSSTRHPRPSVNIIRSEFAVRYVNWVGCTAGSPPSRHLAFLPRGATKTHYMPLELLVAVHPHVSIQVRLRIGISSYSATVGRRQSFGVSQGYTVTIQGPSGLHCRDGCLSWPDVAPNNHVPLGPADRAFGVCSWGLNTDCPTEEGW